MDDTDRNPWDAEIDRLEARLDELEREVIATLDELARARLCRDLYPDAPTDY
jgi:hypothetical protein